jgi:hypothetical protein
LGDINFAILIYGLRLLNNLEEGARDTSGPPELWTAIVVWISVGRACLNPVTFLATAMADVAGWWRLVRDCCLLREKWTVVDTLTTRLSVYTRNSVANTV